MESDLFSRGRRVSDHGAEPAAWWEMISPRSIAGQLADPAPPEAEWKPRVMELQRSEMSRVRATKWSRNDEMVITLQWLTPAADGSWLAMNDVPGPSQF